MGHIILWYTGVESYWRTSTTPYANANGTDVESYRRTSTTAKAWMALYAFVAHYYVYFTLNFVILRYFTLIYVKRSLLLYSGVLEFEKATMTHARHGRSTRRSKRTTMKVIWCWWAHRRNRTRKWPDSTNLLSSSMLKEVVRTPDSVSLAI